MKDIMTSIRRAPYQSMAAFLVLFLTLFISTSLMGSLSFFYGLLGYVETRPQVNAYFQTTTKENDIFKIRNELTNSGKVMSVKYISKQDAYKIYKELNKNNPLLLEMVSADILPPSLEIFAKKPVYLPEISEFLKKQPTIDEVDFQKDIVDRLLSLTTIVRKITFIFFSFLILLSIVVLTTTTLFKIALKREEIELLKLLGATNFYIKKPFLLEGIFFGITSSTISFLILLGVILYLNPFLGSYLKGIPNLTLNFDYFQIKVWPINSIFLGLAYLISTIFGCAIATIATLLATNKYQR